MPPANDPPEHENAPLAPKPGRGSNRGSEEPDRGEDGAARDAGENEPSSEPRDTAPGAATGSSDRARRRAIERFEVAHTRVSQAAVRLGQSQHRDRRGFEIFNLHAEIEREIATLRDVFERFPDVHEAILEIRRLNEQIGLERRLDADRFAIELNRAVRGAMVNFSQLTQLLLWREPHEIDFICQAFRDRYGQSLTEAVQSASRTWHVRLLNVVLRKDLERESRRVRFLAAKRRDEAVAISIYLSLRWCWGKDTESLRQIFRRHSVAEVASVESCYGERFRGEFGSETLDEALQAQLNDRQFSPVHALRWDQFARAEAMRLRELLRSKRPDLSQVSRLIRELPADDRKELRRTWRQLYGEGLREYVSPKLEPKQRQALGDYLTALIAGKMTTASAAWVRLSFLSYPGTWLGEVFVGQSRTERHEIVRLFEKNYGQEFQPELERAYRDRTNRQLMKNLVAKGSLSPADLLRDCMHGFGTDEKGIERILLDIPRDELAGVEEEYRKFRRWDFIEGLRPRPLVFLRHVWATLREPRGRGHRGVVVPGANESAPPPPRGFWARFKARAEVPRDLWMDLAAELDGDDWRDIAALRTGRPETLEELYEFTVDRHRREVEGKFSGLVHRLSREGTALDRDIRAARDFYESQIRGRQPGEHQERRLRTLLAYAQHAFESFRETKHTVAFVSANLVSGGLVTLTVALVLHFKRPLLWVMIGAFLASASSRIICRILVAARGYGREKVVQDISLASIDGLTLAMGTFARRFLGPLGRRFLRSSLSEKFIKASSSFVLKRLVQTGRELDTKKRSRHLTRTSDPIERVSTDVNQILERLSIYT